MTTRGLSNGGGEVARKARSRQLLGVDDPITSPVDRVLVCGVSGSGKTTLARAIGVRWGLPHTEIDGLYHGPGWEPRPEFLADVSRFAREARWVTEWQYTSKGAGEILEPRAQLAVWLDYSRPVVRWRLFRRTFGRGLLRTRLWNGNREGPVWRMLSRDPEQNIMAWQTKTLHTWRSRMAVVLARNPDLSVVRLRTPRETRRWLAALPERRAG
ncbi:AAA family ATPase [Leucobacter chromiireducens]|uniref:AAA family ATPase n=1 Tax=Leucobacter chromiireducens TaxID=283877 RepID=UPI001F42FE0C|nr:AAA family ATPase [Leucobacter chromiireducens]